jgi:hypothetical protein
MSNAQTILQRNDKCHCGSGKKYKKCHMREDQVQSQREALSQAQSHGGSASFNKNFWKVFGIGTLVTGMIGSYWGKGFMFAGAWMILYSVTHSLMRPPQAKEEKGDPAGLDFGRKN